MLVSNVKPNETIRISMVITLWPHKRRDMYKVWLTIGVVGVLFVGCAEDTADTNKEVEANKAEAVTEAPEEAKPVEFTVSDLVPADTEATTGEVKLNPAHGQPGHDCAIAVGAPLDGSGGQAQPSLAPTVAQPATQVNTQAAAPANGINPPHGQPGHDCAVAVGAPLPAK